MTTDEATTNILDDGAAPTSSTLVEKEKTKKKHKHHKHNKKHAKKQQDPDGIRAADDDDYTKKKKDAAAAVVVDTSAEELARAVEAFDKETAASSLTSSETASDIAGAEDPKTVKDMLQVMDSQSDGTNVIQESIKTLNMNFKDKKGDIKVSTKKEGLAKLHTMILADKAKRKTTHKKYARWEFRASPHEQFEKTLDDTFLAFLQWAKSENNENGEEEKEDQPPSYNVSKAFRRLEHYADWMDDTGDDLISSPLTAASVQEANKAWGMKSSIDKNGNYIWWIDLKAIDKVAVKTTISPTDSLRGFVWYSHFVMYNPNAQENGFVFVENCAKIGFLEMFTLAPMKLSVKLDRLTIGVLPIKMKACYILETSTWMDLFMNFMGLFMSKKMKQRMRILKNWEDLEDIVGKECIPKNFGKLEGNLEVDLVDAKYYS